MVDSNDDERLEARPPTVDDLLRLCRELNSRGARYIVIGGMAMIQVGFVRATEDIDILIEASPDNQRRVREALSTLPDNAVKDLAPDDLVRYMVVRIADEFVVDLLISACGVEYASAETGIERVRIRDVEIPFAGPELLWRLKQTMREKDRQDVLFLKALLGK